MKYLLILLSLMAGCVSAQNLIPDSSFEYNKFIPVDYSCIGSSGNWSSPSRATTDLFCKCGKKEKKISVVNVPDNSMGKQEAHSGKCYAGIFACSHGYYREYLMSPLKSPLEEGKEYVLSFYISLSDYSPLAIDKLGVCFLNGKVKYDHSDIITNLRPYYIPLEEEVGMESNDWHQLNLRFKAKGGEDYILIGSFAIKRLWRTGNAPPPLLSTPINKKIERDAYYYFDDVSIYEYKPEKIDTTQFINPIFTYTETPDTVIVSNQEPETIDVMPPDMVMTFKNVLFKSGEAILAPSSFSELDVLAIYLKGDLKSTVEIYGHTDNAGDENKNLELSKNRAKAVCDYLVAKGVDEKRVNFDGFGSSKPLESNDTEEGRKMNRRVEFVLKKK